MQISDINRVVEQVSRDKGIDREVLIKALEEALKSAARKKFGNKMDIEVQYNNDTGEIERAGTGRNCPFDGRNYCLGSRLAQIGASLS